MDVPIQMLQYFCVLAEELHFGRAAARLHIAQPALSQQLRQLEREVGSRLLERSTRRVDLTEAGRLLRMRAHEVLATLDQTSADIELLAAGRAGRVRVGFVGTATYDVLPRVALRVRAEPVLEPCDLLAEGRRGDAEPRCGPAEVQLLGEHAEVLEHRDGHVHDPNVSLRLSIGSEIEGCVISGSTRTLSAHGRRRP